MARAGILKSVYKALENHAPLRTFLGHTKGATSITAGARIVGDSIRLQDLPLPILVLGFEAGEALAPQREQKTWALECLLYTEDVWQAAELLDLIEDACLAYRFDAAREQPLSRLQPGPHQRLEPDTPAGRIIATRMTLTATWVS